MTRVKICGITNLPDAEYALHCGADALGFVFAESPRRISIKSAKKIIKAIGPWISTVGVFVNENASVIRRISSECGLSMVQLHGDESAAFMRKLSETKIIKSFRISERNDLAQTKHCDADAYLFDSRSISAYGGTGKIFDWTILGSTTFSKPIIVSGGLNPDNVRKAVKLIRPYGVDVSSGVEKFPGKKDAKLVKEFIQNAKRS